MTVQELIDELLKQPPNMVVGKFQWIGNGIKFYPVSKVEHDTPNYVGLEFAPGESVDR